MNNCLTVTPKYANGQRVVFGTRAGVIETASLHRLHSETYVVEYKIRWDDAPNELMSVYDSILMQIEP